MKARNNTWIAWGCVLVAIAAWAGVAMFALAIQARVKARSSQLTKVESAATVANKALLLNTLARDTKDLRGQLDNLTQVDALGVVNIIEGVGKITGTKVTISNALSNTELRQTNSTSTPALHSLSFLVGVEGSFSALMRAAALFETLPVLSSVQSLEFERIVQTTRSKVAMWRMTAQIIVLSSSNI